MEELIASLNKYTDFDIGAICSVGDSVYVMATFKSIPSCIYLSWTTSTLGNPIVVQFYDSPVPLQVNPNSLLVGSNLYKCLYYTYENNVYCWDLKKQLPTTPVIGAPAGMDVTSLSMDAEGKLLYVGLYEKGETENLKGHLYIYDVKTSTLINKYHNIADKPIKIIYKERS